MSTTRDLVDSWTSGIVKKFKPSLKSPPFNLGDDKHTSACFALLCASTLLELSDEDLLDGLTEGGDDNGIDYIYISDLADGEFTVSLFQAKYDKIEGPLKNFPESGVLPLLNTLKLFMRSNSPLPGNKRFLKIAEEIRSLIRDGQIPRFSIYLCNNGLKWNESVQKKIAVETLNEQQFQFHHINHDAIFKMKEGLKPVKVDLKFSGMSHIDQFSYKRVVIGKVTAKAIYDLVESHGNMLFESNIRRYLGTRISDVNAGMKSTLSDSLKRGDFYFLNNGITCLCSQFRHQGVEKDNTFKIEDFQIVNGAQTCHTIHATVSEVLKKENPESFNNVFVLVRLYEVQKEDGIADKITFATNHQNPIEIYDLRSNDAIQKALEKSFKELEPDLIYRRRRDGAAASSHVISPLTVAESVFAVWNGRPHTAKFRRLDLFRKHYDEIFSEGLTAAQALSAVNIFRFVETKRKNTSDSFPDWVGYASYFIAALIGKKLLSELGIDRASKLSNKNYLKAKEVLAVRSEEFYLEAINNIDSALQDVLKDPTLQKLSAVFRRPDLCEKLQIAKC